MSKEGSESKVYPKPAPLGAGGSGGFSERSPGWEVELRLPAMFEPCEGYKLAGGHTTALAEQSKH